MSTASTTPRGSRSGWRHSKTLLERRKDLRDDTALVQVAIPSRGNVRGALLLSEFTGASTELRGAFTCNPFDTAGMSTAMESALATDTQERTRRLAQMAKRVARHDIHRWADLELRRLESTSDAQA